MKRNRLLAFVTVLVLFVVLNGCGTKPRSLGSLNKVIVLADSTLWQQVEKDVRDALEIIVYTPRTEKIFSLSWRDPKELGELTRYRNLLLVGTLDGDEPTQSLIRKMLGEKGLQRVESGEGFLFQKENAWARDQLLVLLVAKDAETLKAKIQENKKAIFATFDDHTNEIVARSMFFHFEKKDIEKQLLERHGWMVRVQADYVLAIDSVEARFVWLRRMGPQRWFSVYYEPVEDPSILSKEWMLETRNRLTKQFYEGDFVYEDEELKIREEDIDFNGRFAIKLDGIWQNTKYNIGGPFRSIAFYNESDQRLYLIDLAVFAPEEKKWPYLRQLEVIARTFRTKDEL